MRSFPPAVVVLYPVTVFFSAALLFLVEPMVGKLLLPSLGGSPEVWITTLLFFQAALLAGYAYGHVVAGRLTPRRQTLLHLALLAVALAVLPIGVHPGSPRSGSAHPTLWLLGQLAVTVGLPFFAVAANGPLLQHWLAGTRHRAARDPFFLYAASNLGSVVGLLAYPTLIEPLLPLHTQTLTWAWGYGALVLLVGGCAVTVWRLSGAGSLAPARPTMPADRPGDGEPADRPGDGEPEDRPGDGEPETAAGREGGISPTWGRRARWVALAFVPASFMLGTTTFITRDLAPVPLLWVIPLAIYLVSFVIAFARHLNPTRLVAATRLALPVVLVALVYTMAIGSQRPLWLLLALHLLALLAAALMCHARLAEDRPGAEHLTGFYLWVSVGGVLGGVFNALLAPVVFPSLIEYPVAIVAACLLRPRSPRSRPTIIAMLTGKDRLGRVIDVTVAGIFGLALAAGLDATASANPTTAFAHRSTILGFAAGLAVNFARRPLRFALAIVAVFLAATVGAGTPGSRVLVRERTFFGIYRVESVDGYHDLRDGTTLHGSERIGGGGPPEPLTYYSRSGPVGQTFAALPDPSLADRTAIIGLGSGAMACYSRPGQRWTFYEIDPAIARIARDPRLFTYLRDCPGRFDIVIGDARRSLASARGALYGVIAVDAFSSDAIPVHLLTREALGLYLTHLESRGLLLFHISNRYLDLSPELGALAADAGLTCREEEAKVTPAEAARHYAQSTWVLMARRDADLGRVAGDRRWKGCPGASAARVWTDDYSSLLSFLKIG